MEKTNFRRKIELTNSELTYLRLYVYGYTKKDYKKNQISFSCSVPIIKKQIETKFKSKDWWGITKIAFEEDLLERYDFVEKEVKNEASSYTHDIYDFLVSNAETDKRHTELLLRRKIIGFINSCDRVLFNKPVNSVDIITKEEQEELLSAYNKFCYPYSNRGYVFNERENRSILKKLNANSLYNAIRKAFQCRILDYKDFISINIKSEALIYANRIVELNSGIKQNDLEVKMKIYHCLIQFFNVFEHDYLLPNIEKGQINSNQVA